MKTHVIITYSKVHYPITAEQEAKLRDMHLDDNFDIDGNIIKVRNIADVLTMDKYYETYPDKKPGYIDRYKELPGWGLEGTIKFSRDNAVKNMIIGLKRYISGPNYKGTEAPLELLKSMELKLKSLTNI